MAPLAVAVGSLGRALQRSRCVGGTAASARTSACGPVPSSCAKSAVLTELGLTELALSASEPGITVTASAATVAARKCVEGDLAARHRHDEGPAIPPPPPVKPVAAPPSAEKPPHRPAAAPVAAAPGDVVARRDGLLDGRARRGEDGDDAIEPQVAEAKAATEAALPGGPSLRSEVRPDGAEGDGDAAKAVAEPTSPLSSTVAPPGAPAEAAPAATARSGAAAVPPPPAAAPSAAMAAGVAALPLNEHLDRDSRAAAAAAALLRRLAKVGPDKTPEEAAVAWCSSSKASGRDFQRFVRRRRLDLPRAKATSRGAARADPSSRRSESEAAWWMDDAPAREDGSGTQRRRVRFTLPSSAEVLEIPAYAEIYGRHPREFVFGRHSDMLPAGDRFGFVGQEVDSDTEEDEPTDPELPSAEDEASDQVAEFPGCTGAASEELHMAHTAVAVC